MAANGSMIAAVKEWNGLVLHVKTVVDITR